MAENSYYEDQLAKAKTRFTSATSLASPLSLHDRMLGHDKLLNRNDPVELQGELGASQEGIDYQSYELEKALFDHQDILKMNPTLFDVIAYSQSARAKQVARDIMLWCGKSWEVEDYGRSWDIGSSGGQVKHGFTVQRQMWKEQDLKGDYDEDDSGNIRRKRHPFYWKLAEPYGVYWLGDEQSEYGPDICFYEYELPYLEMQKNYKRRNESGEYEYPTIDSLDKLNWLAQDQRIDTEPEMEIARVVVCDYRDSARDCPIEGCNHPQRVIKTFICRKDGRIDDDNYVTEVDSPFPCCSFYIIGGRMQLDETDPNLRFRPLIGPLLGEGQMVNYLTTLLLAMIRKDYSLSRLYLDVSAVQNQSLLPSGEDAENQVLEFPQPDEGKIAFFPGEIKRMPSEISQHLLAELANHKEKMSEYKPNRFAIGDAYSEASNATGTAYIAAQQQSSLPYNTLLAESDKAILKSRLAEIHAIKFWALSDPEGVSCRYYAVTSSDQTHVKYTGKPPKAGEVIWVDAAKLSSIDYDIIIKTQSLTQAEQGALWNLAVDQHERGALPTDRYIAATGTDDVVGTMEQLVLDKNRALIQPHIDQLKTQAMLRIFYGQTGIDFGGQGLGMQPGQPGAPQSQTSEQPPPGSSQNNGGTFVPANNGAGMGRMAPTNAITNSPHGGSNPVGLGY